MTAQQLLAEVEKLKTEPCTCFVRVTEACGYCGALARLERGLAELAAQATDVLGDTT